MYIVSRGAQTSFLNCARQVKKNLPFPWAEAASSAIYKSKSRFQGCEGTPAFISAKSLILPDFPAHSHVVRTSPAPSDFKVAPMAGICRVRLVLFGFFCFFFAFRRRFTIITRLSREDSLRVGAEKNPHASGEDSRRRTEPSRADCRVHGCCGKISQQNRVIEEYDNESSLLFSRPESRQMLRAV